MVLLNNGTTVHIVEYLENSLGRHSNRSLEEMVLLSVGMSLYTILGVLGNGLVLMALITQRRWAGLDSVMLIFIFNLTSCDFLICLITFPATAISSAVDKWILGSTFCWVVAVCATYLRIAAILFMTMICIHRVIVIMYPFDDVITDSRGKVACVFIWIVSLAPQIFPFFGYNPFHYDPIRALCIADLHTDNATISVSSIAAIIYVAIPMLLITLIYSKILYIAISSRRKRLNIGQVSSGRTSKPGSKAIITTLILVGSFILCFLPFLVITGVNQATNSVTGGMIIWGEFSSSLHCVLNPLIYFHTNLTFRKFLLRPFRGTVLEKTKFFTKYNDTGTNRQHLNISNAIILQKNPRLSAAARPSSSLPRISLTKIHNLSHINENSVVKSQPINRKVLAPTISSVTDNTILSQSDLYSVPDTNTIMSQSEFSVGDNTVMSEFSVVSHDYEELWETNNDCFEIRQNTI
ncbi:alpha-1A adrenergic receptor-like [Bolinopsis microptera]|uniref:alpha-1A adrenergic receptor-like n=1 Tax=Bolinopsis microptera TaxID=2820187 RepID=UPI003079B701